MTLCRYFLQGSCRFGNECWYEHSRDGRGGGGGRRGGGGDYRPSPQPSRGGFGNRVWINPSQRSENTRAAPSRDFSGNRFSAFNAASEDAATSDEFSNQLETVQKEVEAWQSSGQWPFSCYSVHNTTVAGMLECSPEELRLEYYSGLAAGDLKPYMNSVQQMMCQWMSRIQELRSIRTISELRSSSSQGQTSSGVFGSSSGFGSAPPPPQSSSSFSFCSPARGFGSGFSDQLSGAVSSPSSSGFGSSASSAASFSFSASAGGNKALSSAADFSFKPAPSTAPVGAFGSGFGSSAAPAPGTGLLGAAPGFVDSGNGVFTATSELTEDELKEFSSARFTLGQIPLKPPPAHLLLL